MEIGKYKFDEKGLIVAIAQDAFSGEILMQAFMNKEAIEKTYETGIAHYYSRSRQKLWKKGEESGHIQKVLSITSDCDNDCVVLKIHQEGVACHTGAYSCFFNTEKVFEEYIGIEMLAKLSKIINSRKTNAEEGSYTSFLFKKGVDKIAKKVGEESAELIIASKNNDKDEIKCETADLLYHIMVLLEDRNVELSDVCKELFDRHNEK